MTAYVVKRHRRRVTGDDYDARTRLVAVVLAVAAVAVQVVTGALMAAV